MQACVCLCALVWCVFFKECMCSVDFCNELLEHHEQDLVDDEEVWKLFRGDSALSDPIDDLLLDPAQSDSAQKDDWESSPSRALAYSCTVHQISRQK